MSLCTRWQRFIAPFDRIGAWLADHYLDIPAGVLAFILVLWPAIQDVSGLGRHIIAAQIFHYGFPAWIPINFVVVLSWWRAARIVQRRGKRATWGYYYRNGVVAMIVLAVISIVTYSSLYFDGYGVPTDVEIRYTPPAYATTREYDVRYAIESAQWNVDGGRHINDDDAVIWRGTTDLSKGVHADFDIVPADGGGMNNGVASPHRGSDTTSDIDSIKRAEPGVCTILVNGVETAHGDDGCRIRTFDVTYTPWSGLVVRR
ncbi:hypothetical protein [Bifidobacterium primatium]|nr:hypothetical protein [Bifidobacterium primatium]